MTREIMKPELNEADKKRANELYCYLRQRGTYCTKQELCAAIGWDYTSSNDRRIREMISNLAKVKPIISTSDSRGYKLATTPDDREEARHQWAELSKRADEIMARCAPLINFLEG